MKKIKVLLKTLWFWVLVCLFFFILFGVLYNITDNNIFGQLGLVFVFCIGGFAFIGLVFAWIVNPIKWFIQKNKDKKLEK